MIRRLLLVALGIALIGVAIADTQPPPAPGSGSGSAPVLAPPTARPVPKTLVMRKGAPAHGGFVDDLDCSACHTAAGWELSQSAGKSGFDHDRTGFPLRSSHKQTDCGGCHAGAVKPSRTCEGCHRDPHQKRINGPCAECHRATTWTDTRALEQHQRTRMPLTGRHATTECVECHQRKGARQWSDVPRDCYGCHRTDFHADIHPVHDGRDGTPLVSRECGLCHQTSAWSPAICSMGVAPCPTDRLARQGRRSDHDRWFTLSVGSHRTADCAACHADPRRPMVARCDGCHGDVRLRQQHRGKAVAGRASACLRCHPRGAAR